MMLAPVQFCPWILLLLLVGNALDSPSQQVNPEGQASTRVAGEQENEVRREFSQTLSEHDPTLQSHAQSAHLDLQIGRLRGQTGDFSGAVTAFRHALEIQPDFAEAHYDLGLALLAGADNVPPWTAALKEFRAAIKVQPQFPEALRMVGVCLLESGDAQGAIPELKAALRLNPASAEINFDIGRALTILGNRAEAKSEYAAALARKSPYPQADSALGMLLLNEGQNDAAAEHFNAALIAKPDMEEAHYGLARALKAQGKVAESRLELKDSKMLLQRQSDAIMSSHLSNESLNRAKSGDIPAAVQLGRTAVWLNPANAVADYNLALLLADNGDFEASILQFQKAISLAPFRTEFYVDLSKVQERAGDRNGALKTIRSAICATPTEPALQARLKQLDESNAKIPQCQSIHDSDRFPFGASSDTADDHFAFATQLSTEGDYVGAIGEMLRALTLEPQRSDIRYSLAVAETQIGQIDRAEFELRTVLRSSPNSAKTHMALASLLFQANDLTSAVSEFRQVLLMEPDNHQAARLLKECESSLSRSGNPGRFP